MRFDIPDPMKPLSDRQENLLRQCLTWMSPPAPIMSRSATVPEIEVKHLFNNKTYPYCHCSSFVFRSQRIVSFPKSLEMFIHY